MIKDEVLVKIKTGSWEDSIARVEEAKYSNKDHCWFYRVIVKNDPIRLPMWYSENEIEFVGTQTRMPF